MKAEAVQLFHPLIQTWLSQKFTSATQAQTLAWPKIAQRDHLLITAPTGSGKTLTAFLWSINRFLTGELEPGNTRVLYISPLKALNNDIQRNLLQPLQELRDLADKQGMAFPEIKVRTRSGDTDAYDRRRMLRHPPEILITTPESLNILLTAKSGITLLGGIDTLILDEIHSVVTSKRGSYLMSAVERIVPFSGEFQRIALSATVQPLDMVAKFVGGFIRDVDGGQDGWQARTVNTVSAPGEKQYDISIRMPEALESRGEEDDFWEIIAADLCQVIDQHKSTLVFVNSRALCEKLTFKLNHVAQEIIAWAHHGSLARDIRLAVEQRLKAGELKAIVATGTLEMGIDVGNLDLVVLVQSPNTVSSTIQRIGRAGHSVGQVSQCLVYPSHNMDCIEAAVLARAVMERDIEPVKAIVCPMDVLAQIIISMTAHEAWDLDELFMELRRSLTFHTLTQRQFNLVTNMLAGRYADHNVRELKPRVSLDRTENTIQARPGSVMSYYLSGGVIPDRGYYQLRHNESNARIGDLDEEFVWEARVGQVFSFGTQHWRINKITHNDVMVTPGSKTVSAPPFWTSETVSRDFHYSERVGNFLEYANEHLTEPDFPHYLQTMHHLEPWVAGQVHEFLGRQRDHCQQDLPHRHHLLIEQIARSPGGAQGFQIVLHTGWGQAVNRPWAMAMEAAWLEKSGELPEIYVSNECLVLQLPPELDPADLISLVSPDSLEDLLRRRLEGSGFFGARFRENAGRALLLSKGKFNERKPLWMSRLQSQKLMESVQRYEDFPILLETWRTCFQDEFDMPNLKAQLAELQSGVIRVSVAQTVTPSPMAASVAWDQINTYMYMDDSSRSARSSNLSTDLLREVVFDPEMRPLLSATLIGEFVSTRQRLKAGYAPDSESDWTDWTTERAFIPLSEWRVLREGAEPLISPRLFLIESDTAQLVVSRDQALTVLNAVRNTSTPGAARLLPLNDTFSQCSNNTGRLDLEVILNDGSSSEDEPDVDLATLLGNWLQYYGPLTVTEMARLTGVAADRLTATLRDLAEQQLVVTGSLVHSSVHSSEKSLTTTDAAEQSWCDADNYEILLRLNRRRQTPRFEPLPPTALQPFLHHWQSRTSKTDELDQLFEVMERLEGVIGASVLWEKEYLPSRLPAFQSNLMDLLFQEGEILWLGYGEGKHTFLFKEDLDLYDPYESDMPKNLEALLGDNERLDFNQLLDKSGLTATVLSDQLWQAAWSSHLTNDTINSLRRGISTNFKVPSMADLASPRRRSSRRGGFGRWRGSLPVSGNWSRLFWPTGEADALDNEQKNRDRARILLTRYGLIFRELLQREHPGWQWRAIFRALRLMELSGEILSGYFIEDIPGPQFILPEAFRFLQRQDPERIFWLNATDPICVAGLGIRSFTDPLPRRLASNHVVFKGAMVVLVSERQGRALDIRVDPDDPGLVTYFEVLRHLMYRAVEPLNQVTIESINSIPANRSPYLDTLKTCFNVISDHRQVYLERSIQGTST